jgi:hypothetical protein
MSQAHTQAATAYFKALFQYSHKNYEENHKT